MMKTEASEKRKDASLVYIWMDSGLGWGNGNWKASEAEMTLLCSEKGKETQ